MKTSRTRRAGASPPRSKCRPKASATATQENRGPYRDVDEVECDRAQLDGRRRRWGHEERLERAHQLLSAQGGRDPVECELHEDAERDPDRRELQVGDLSPAERRQLAGVDHQADEVEEQHLARRGSRCPRRKPFGSSRRPGSPVGRMRAASSARRAQSAAGAAGEGQPAITSGSSAVRARKASSISDRSCRQARTWTLAAASAATTSPSTESSSSETRKCSELSGPAAATRPKGATSPWISRSSSPAARLPFRS